MKATEEAAAEEETSLAQIETSTLDDSLFDSNEKSQKDTADAKQIEVIKTQLAAKDSLLLLT